MAASTTNPIVFFDIALGGLGGEDLGRVKMELYADVTPKTAENFRQFCTGEGPKDIHGKPQGYKACKFHRVIKGFMIQGGDFIKGDGTGAISTFGTQYFADENFNLMHDKEGLLSMANAGPNTNGSQFFITCAPAPHLDKKHVVYGRVIEGMDIVKKVENVRTNYQTGRPMIDVVIKECGEM